MSMTKDNELDILVVTFEPFPIGMAATNRILSWTKVLAENNISIEISIVKPTEKLNNINNIQPVGDYKGIKFEYLNGTTIWSESSSYISKAFTLLIGHLKLVRKLVIEKPRTVVTYTPFLYTRVLIIVFRIFLNYKLIIEETEYPKILKRKGRKLFRKIYLSSYKFADGMMVMTNELKSYYQKLKVKDVFVLPMTVESSRFIGLQKQELDRPYFIYVGGSGGFVRDGVFDIVAAFALFIEANKDYQLKIVGPINRDSSEFIKMDNFIKSKRLENLIIFVGSKPSTEIPQLLINAVGIVMAPPINFSSGGFPTKLGEFMASATPVICTMVSDIPLYLNVSNSFPIKPMDIVAIKDAMEQITNNPGSAKIIGENARKTCLQYFDSNNYKRELISFLCSDSLK